MIQTPLVVCAGCRVRKAVGGSSSSSQLSPGGSSTEMISNGCPDPNRTVLVKGVGENLLPTAQPWRLWRPGLPVATPGAGDSHVDLFGYLGPGQALVTQLHDQLCGGGMSGRTANTRVVEFRLNRSSLVIKVRRNVMRYHGELGRPRPGDVDLTTADRDTKT